MKTIILGILCILTLVASAQNVSTNEEKFKPTLKFKGYSQIYFATSDYSDEVLYGFTMRRIRLSPYGDLAKNISYSLTLGFDQMAPSIVEANINFKPIDEFQIMAGFIATPGAKSGAVSDKLFSTTKMNLIERSMVTQNYNTKMASKSYRDLGVQLHGYLFDKKLYYATMLANPKADDVFAPSVKNANYTHKVNGIKSISRIELLSIENMGIGGFYSVSSYKDSIDNFNRAMGAHIIYSSEKFKFFSEVISGSMDPESNYASDYKYLGYFFEFGYNVNKKIMPVVGLDIYKPVDDGSDDLKVESYTNYTLGCNLFLNENVKLMANYIIRNEKTAKGYEDIDLKNDLFIICLQFSYKQE